MFTIIGVMFRVVLFGYLIYSADKVGTAIGEAFRDFDANISGLNDDIRVDF